MVLGLNEEEVEVGEDGAEGGWEVWLVSRQDMGGVWVTYPRHPAAWRS